MRVRVRNGRTITRRSVRVLGLGASSLLRLAPLSALVLGACTFTEVRPGLDIPVPGRFDRAAPKSAPPLTADWPALFGSRELTLLGRQTAAGNLDVAAAAARIYEADAQTIITSSVLYPQINSDSNVSRSLSPSSGRTGAGVSSTSTSTSTGTSASATGTSSSGGTTTGSGATTVTTTSPATSTVLTTGSSGNVANSFQLGLTASYEVDLWGKNRFASLAAAQNADATRFARDALVLSSVATTVNAYLTLLSSQDRLRIAADNLKAAQEALAAIKGRLEVGTVTALEVAEQQSVVDQQFAAFPPLQQQLQQAKTQLALLTGRTPESLNVKGGSLTTLKPPTIPVGLPSELLRRRPDVAEAEDTLLSADSSVQSARAAFFPTITLTGDGGFESTALRTLLRPESEFASIAAGVTEPLFDGYNLQGQLALARGRVREYLADYRKSVVQSLVDVENALIAIAQNTEHEKRLVDVVKSSRLAYDISLVRLREGTIDIVTLLSTEQTLFNAEDAAAVARLARFTAIASLAQALGGGFTFPTRPSTPTFTVNPADPVTDVVPLAGLRGS